MKKLTLAILYLGMMIQPIHAESIMEKAKKIYDRAIALAKKGGARSKELLSKANFLGNAIKKLEIADEALDSCKRQYCSNEIQEKLRRYYSGSQEGLRDATYTLNECKKTHCALEQKMVNKTIAPMVASASALFILLNALIYGPAVYMDYKEKAEEAKKPQEIELQELTPAKAK